MWNYFVKTGKRKTKNYRIFLFDVKFRQIMSEKNNQILINVFNVIDSANDHTSNRITKAKRAAIMSQYCEVKLWSLSLR